MDMNKFKLYTKNLDAYTVRDVGELEFMTDAELDEFQHELEEDSGNISNWDLCRMVITMRKKIHELENK